jgi:hypothetical protein
MLTFSAASNSLTRILGAGAEAKNRGAHMYLLGLCFLLSGLHTESMFVARSTFEISKANRPT